MLLFHVFLDGFFIITVIGLCVQCPCTLGFFLNSCTKLRLESVGMVVQYKAKVLFQSSCSHFLPVIVKDIHVVKTLVFVQR